MASANSEPISILNIEITAETEQDAVAWLRETLDGGGSLRQIATYNPEYAIAARNNEAFLAALQGCELVTADGIGIELAARLRRKRLERVTGVRLLELLAASGEPLFLLGAGPGVAELAADRLNAAQPNTVIAGYWADGTPDARHDEETFARLRQSGARIVAVAYGAPAQVLWIERNRAALTEAGVRIAVGVGGALDYWSGIAPIPPVIVQKIGFEWFWRLVREPKRWRRQLALPQFAILASLEAIRHR